MPRQPIYFNTVRDPYERQVNLSDTTFLKLRFMQKTYFRFKSRFYWHRKDFQAESWFEDYHLIEPDADPRGRDYW